MVTRKGHSLKSIPGGLEYFLCLGPHACVIMPATLGFHLIKTLASIPQGVKTSRAFQVCDLIRYLSPSPGRGGQLGCFYDQEASGGTEC